MQSLFIRRTFAEKSPCHFSDSLLDLSDARHSFMPKGMFAQLAGSKTIYDYAQSSAYPLEHILKLADGPNVPLRICWVSSAQGPILIRSSATGRRPVVSSSRKKLRWENRKLL